MPAKNDDLHGNAPDESPVALLLIDVINDMQWEGGDSLLPQALQMASRLAAFKRRAKTWHVMCPSIWCGAIPR